MLSKSNNLSNSKWNQLSLKIKIIIIVFLAILTVGGIILVVSINSAEHNAFDPFRQIIKEGKGFVIVKPEDPVEYINMVNDRRNIFILQMFFTIIFICIIVSVLLYFILSKLLAPFETLAKDIKDIDETNLDYQLDIKTNSSEVSDVLISFNTLLQRLSNAFSSQKLFSANVAHELKTPLTIMKTNKQVFDLDKRPTKSEYRTLIELMDRQSNRLIEIVETLLKMNDKHNLGKDNFKTKEVVADILNDLDTVIKRKGIAIKVKGDRVTNSDKNLFKRAVFNIIDNAIKYSGDSKKINININDDCIEVVDYGIGIDIENPNQIFEPFYRIDNSRSRLSGGSGLGLALTKQILDMLDIEIEVLVRQDGTSFVIKFIEMSDTNEQKE
jgi:signal transduction histidine kinase